MYDNKNTIRDKFLKKTFPILPSKTGPVAITLHHVAEKDFEWLESILDSLLEKYDFVNPNEFSMKKSDKKKLLLTFDDGFLVNKYMVEQVLKPRQIKAMFFIVNNFIGLENIESIDFVKKRFFPNSSPSESFLNECYPMKLSDILWLIEDGHCIGAHTKNHPRLSSISYERQLDEIVASANELEALINTKITSFAYPFGSVEAINKDSYEIVKNRFEFGFSNVRGMINESPSKYFIYRQNIVPQTPFWMVKAIIEGKIDLIHNKVRQKSKQEFSD